jgi:hypothetical protein
MYKKIDQAGGNDSVKSLAFKKPNDLAIDCFNGILASMTFSS